MKSVVTSVLFATNFAFFLQLSCGKNSSEIHTVYKKIGEDLINLRKEFSAAQPKVYSLLDQVDKMYTLTKTTQQKKTDYRKKYQESIKQGARALQENEALKSQVKNLEGKLLFTSTKLEEEKQLREYLAKVYQAKPVHVEKIAPTVDNQSLSLTSTSEPISPR